MKKFDFKKMLTIFLIIVFVSFNNFSNVRAVGTPISSCVGLLEMSNLSGSFYLTQDIDCSGTSG